MSKAKITLKVEGMSCEHCVNTVTKTLNELDGVKKAKVNLKHGQATVTYDSDIVMVDELISAVEEAGYDTSAP